MKRCRLPALLAILLCWPLSGWACMPLFPLPLFVLTYHPDLPLDSFAEGRIGVLQPSYARSYLYVAYRAMQGPAFDADERKALVDYWAYRLERAFDDPAAEWTKPWLDARAQVLPNDESAWLYMNRTINGDTYWIDYLNCTPDAFQSAARTLQARIQTWGAKNPLTLDWVRGQDAVFSNCSSGENLPAAAPAGAEALLVADRAYQTAAAHFYAGHFLEAARLFQAIDSDTTSPWKPLAPYLIARCWIREASVGEKSMVRGATDATASNELLKQARTALEAIVGDPAQSALHDSARGLLALVASRLDPAGAVQSSAARLLQPGLGSGLFQELFDFVLALDRNPPGLESNDLTDWLTTFHGDPAETDEGLADDDPAPVPGPDADSARLAHSLERWKAKGSLPWLVAALTLLPSGHAEEAGLLAEAAKVPAESAAYPTVSFHRARLLAAAGRTEEARQALDALLARKELLPASGLNASEGLRAGLASDLGEFLRFAQRVPAMISYNEDVFQEPMSEESWKYAADDASQDSLVLEALKSMQPGLSGRLLEQVDSLPLARLQEALAGDGLAPLLKRSIAISAWTRAVLLGREEEAVKLASVLAPLAAPLQERLAAYAAAAAGARFPIALALILETPALTPRVPAYRLTALQSIDNHRGNWWCAQEAELKELPAFLTESDRTAAAEERRQLAALGTAPDYLAQKTIEWAEANPNAPEAARLLHLAVRTTRYGCTGEQSSKWSKSAFQLLHKQYPQSEWAKKTPYWFNN